MAGIELNKIREGGANDFSCHSGPVSEWKPLEEFDGSLSKKGASSGARRSRADRAGLLLFELEAGHEVRRKAMIFRLGVVSQLKHEVIWKPFDIAFYGRHQHSRFNPIEVRQRGLNTKIDFIDLV